MGNSIPCLAASVRCTSEIGRADRRRSVAQLSIRAQSLEGSGALAQESAIGILNSHVALVQTAKLKRPEVHVPDAVVDFLKAHVFADAHGGYVDPAPVPADAAVGADVTHFEAVGIFQRRQPAGRFAG